MHVNSRMRHLHPGALQSPPPARSLCLRGRFLLSLSLWVLPLPLAWCLVPCGFLIYHIVYTARQKFDLLSPAADHTWAHLILITHVSRVLTQHPPLPTAAAKVRIDDAWKYMCLW